MDARETDEGRRRCAYNKYGQMDAQTDGEMR